MSFIDLDVLIRTVSQGKAHLPRVIISLDDWAGQSNRQAAIVDVFIFITKMWTDSGKLK